MKRRRTPVHQHLRECLQVRGQGTRRGDAERRLRRALLHLALWPLAERGLVGGAETNSLREPDESADAESVLDGRRRSRVVRGFGRTWGDYVAERHHHEQDSFPLLQHDGYGRRLPRHRLRQRWRYAAAKCSCSPTLGPAPTGRPAAGSWQDHHDSRKCVCESRGNRGDDNNCVGGGHNRLLDQSGLWRGEQSKRYDASADSADGLPRQYKSFRGSCFSPSNGSRSQGKCRSG